MSLCPKFQPLTSFKECTHVCQTSAKDAGTVLLRNVEQVQVCQKIDERCSGSLCIDLCVIRRPMDFHIHNEYETMDVPLSDKVTNTNDKQQSSTFIQEEPSKRPKTAKASRGGQKKDGELKGIPKQYKVTSTTNTIFYEGYIQKHWPAKMKKKTDGGVAAFMDHVFECYQLGKPVTWHGHDDTHNEQLQSIQTKLDDALKHSAELQLKLQRAVADVQRAAHAHSFSTPQKRKQPTTSPAAADATIGGAVTSELIRRLDRAISVFSDNPSPAEDSIVSILKDTISDLSDASCSKKSRQKVPLGTPAKQKEDSAARATAEESAKRRDSDRLKPFHNILHWMCDERKEDYATVLKGLANKRDMPQAEVYDLVQSGKGGRVWAMVQEQLIKARKALTAENFPETARLLEELCIPDSAYHKLRTVCGLQNELPTLYKIKKHRAELNKRIMEKLNVKQLQGGGWLVDYAKLWDWVKELVDEGVFPDAKLPDDKLMGILTFDGRSIGGRSQIYVGLKFPWLNFGKTQSCDSIFPVAILPGSDGVGNTAKTFNDVPIGGGKSLTALIKEVRDSEEQTIKHNGQERKIKYQQCFAADQKSMWSLFDICQVPMTKKNPTAQICTYCDCCNASDIKGGFDIMSDPRSDGTYLFDPATECTFCLLHCKLRITERLLFLAAKKAHATKDGKITKGNQKVGHRHDDSLSERETNSDKHERT